MFKPKQIKKKTFIISTESSSSEKEDEGESLLRRGNNTKKPFRSRDKVKNNRGKRFKSNKKNVRKQSLISFDEYEEDEGEEEENKSIVLGFGGCGNNAFGDDEIEVIKDNDISIKSLYGKEELERLKKEQNLRKEVYLGDVDHKEEEEDEDELLNPKVNVIYTGEDALEITENDDKNNKLDSETKVYIDNVADANEVDERWEEQVLKRTLDMKKIKRNDQNVVNTKNNKSKCNSNLKTLDEIQKELISTIKNLEEEVSKTESAMERSNVEITSQQDALKSIQQGVEINETKFKYYLSLRSKIASIVSLLRNVDLFGKIDLVYGSFLDLNKQKKEKDELYWKHIEKDLNKTEEYNPNKEVDEFGRDLCSSEKLHENVRIKRWKEVLASYFETKEGSMYNFDSCTLYRNAQVFYKVLMTFNNQTQLNEIQNKRLTLIEAMDAALILVIDENISLSTLKELNDNFLENSLQEYHQIYAHVSFAELYSVFIRAECCQRFDFLGMGFVNSISVLEDFDWFQLLFKSSSPSSETKIISCILKKIIHPFVVLILEKVYDPTSSNETTILFKFVSSLQKYQHLHETLDILEIVLNSFQDSLSHHLPQEVIKKNLMKKNVDKDPIENLDKMYYIQSMSFIHIHRWKLLLFNISSYWSKLFIEEEESHQSFLLSKKNSLKNQYAQFVFLNILGENYLPVVTFLSNNNVIDHSTVKKELEEIDTCFTQHTCWLQSNNLEMFAAPFRSALLSFNIK